VGSGVRGSGHRGARRPAIGIILGTVALVAAGGGRPAFAGNIRAAASGRPENVTCPGLGTIAVALPSGTTAEPLAPGVQVRVGFQAVDTRTHASVIGGMTAGDIDCGTVPFSRLTAAEVSPTSPPPRVAASDRLDGSWQVSVVAAPATPPPKAAALATPAAAAATPFEGAIQSYLAGRAGAASVAVFDVTAGATYTVAPQSSFITASIVKADILSTLLRQAQGAGRGLTPQEKATATQMIEVSDNNAATTLWNEVGKGPGVAQYNSLLPLPNTFPGSGGLWGLTRTTAPDQVQLVRTLAYSNSILSDSSRAYAQGLMQNVTPSQRWGVSGGVPAGVSIALKNGWLPVSGGWEINSIGHIAGGGRDYVIAVLTSGDPSMGYGITTIQGVSSIVWSQMPKSGGGGLGTGTWYVRNELTSGGADGSLSFGNTGDRPIVGDWNGDGVDTPAVVRGTTWYLRNELTSGGGDIALSYGDAADVPVAGKWGNESSAGIGVFRNGMWYLRSELTSGASDVSFLFGNPGDIPVVGDWTGSGTVGVGVVRGTTWYLRNELSAGPPEFVISYGNPGDVPVVGDWDGDGVAGIGIVRGGTWYLRNTLASGASELSFSFGNPSDTPIAGSWTGAKATRPGVAR
jgi:beta-lactamase class A